MKKINLFNAALGTIAATTCLVPLASCGCGNVKKNNKSLTKDEWHTAIGKVCNVTADRNYTMNVTQYTTSTDPNARFEWEKIVTDYKVKGFTNQIDYQESNKAKGREPTVGAKHRSFNHKYDNVFWNIQTEANEPDVYTQITLISESSFDNEGNFPVYFGLLYDWYDSFSFNSKTKEYTLKMYDFENIKETITLKFDDNKNISDYTMDYYLKTLDGVETTYQDSIQISSYDSSTTSFDETKFKTMLDASIMYIDPASATLSVTHDAKTNTQYIYHFEFSDKTSKTQYLYIVAKYFFMDYFIFRNGKQLTKDVDFTVADAGGVPDDGEYFAFTDPIKASDDIYLCITCEYAKTGAEVSITNTKPH